MINMKKKLHESPQSVDQSLYSNVNFRDGVVGSSYPSKDKINPSLLADIDSAAKKAGITASVTTAVSGHGPSPRHSAGNAVDIAMVNGQGFSSQKDAESKGIYRGIYLFIQELISMGYVYNTESGNDKAVLSFGFKDHDNHIHVSRLSDESGGPQLAKKDDKTPSKTTTQTTTSKTGENEKEEFTDKYGIYAGLSSMIEPLTKVGDELKQKWGQTTTESDLPNDSLINEEINRIKEIMKSWNF